MFAFSIYFFFCESPRFKTEEEAVAIANATTSGLAGAYQAAIR